jgi:hypothetical protein
MGHPHGLCDTRETCGNQWGGQQCDEVVEMPESSVLAGWLCFLQ